MSAKRFAPVLAVAIAALASGLPSPVAAQSSGMTEAEMTEALRKQKTRGLVIAPAVRDQAETAAPETGARTEAAAYEQLPTDIQVNINIRFDLDSAALRPDEKPKLAALCNAVKAADVKVLRIVGHTDAIGSAEYNMRLSQLRAEEVRRHLVAECGLPAEMLEAVGMGKDALLDPQNPRGAVNRRVEFQALG